MTNAKLREAIKTATSKHNQEIVDAALAGMTDDEARQIFDLAMAAHLSTGSGKRTARAMLSAGAASPGMAKVLEKALVW